MICKGFAAAIQGVDAILITVETATDRGTGLSLVGLPDAAVKESADRVSTALAITGFEWPRRRVIINLSPGDVRKEGSLYDLPIALGVLACSDILDGGRLREYLIVGELSLDGTVLPVRGVLPMAILARKLGMRGIIVPWDNVTEAAVVSGIEVYGAHTLVEVLQHLKGEALMTPVVMDTRATFAAECDRYDVDFADVRGQEPVRRAFEVACAGGHNILLVGAPGSGKSMMAKRLPTIMPRLTLHEALETTKIHSVAGRLKAGSMLVSQRPFRAPHHTVSPVALVGGGANPMPGEISLAHNGILFLDEFPEFSRSVLEVLRQPLEDRHITVSRARYSIDYPASFMLVASMNPCPCGYRNHPVRRCTCRPREVFNYMNRISGPLMDRIDIQVEVSPVPFDKLSDSAPGEPSASIRARVERAREIQTRRYAAHPGVHCNAQMTDAMLSEFARPEPEAVAALGNAMTLFNMSARAYARILKVSRTIADLDGADTITTSHVLEAIGYRNLDRGIGELQNTL